MAYGLFYIHSLRGLRMARVSLHLMQYVILSTTSSSARNADNVFTRCVQRDKGIENLLTSNVNICHLRFPFRPSNAEFI